MEKKPYLDARLRRDFIRYVILRAPEFDNKEDGTVRAALLFVVCGQKKRCSHEYLPFHSSHYAII